MKARVELNSPLIAAAMGLPPETKASIAIDTDDDDAEAPPSMTAEEALQNLLPQQAVVARAEPRRKDKVARL